MSQAFNEGARQAVVVNAKSQFESDEEALETLVSLKEVDFGDTFTNRSTQLQSDEDHGIFIGFYHDENQDHLDLRTNSKGDLVIHLSLSGDSISTSHDILNKLLGEVDTITVDQVYLYERFEIPFSSLDLPIKSDTDLDITGVQINREPFEYVLQEDEDEDDETLVSAIRENYDIGETFQADFLISDFNSIEKLIEELS